MAFGAAFAPKLQLWPRQLVFFGAFLFSQQLPLFPFHSPFFQKHRESRIRPINKQQHFLLIPSVFQQTNRNKKAIDLSNSSNSTSSINNNNQFKMSISLWDPFRTSRSVAPFYPRRSLFMDPFEQLERSMNQLDQFFDQSMNVQLRDHAAQLNIDKDSGQLSYKVDTSGFRPEELKVDLEGNQLTVRGEHREENEGETVHRQFVRSVVIPEGIQRESIKCDLDDQGRLCIIGVRNQQPTRSIPIDFKQQQQAQIGQQQPQDQQKLR